MESEGPRVKGCHGPNRSGRPNGTEGAEQTKERRDRGGGEGGGRRGAREGEKGEGKETWRQRVRKKGGVSASLAVGALAAIQGYAVTASSSRST